MTHSQHQERDYFKALQDLTVRRIDQEDMQAALAVMVWLAKSGYCYALRARATRVMCGGV